MECFTEKLLLRFGDTFGTMAVRVWKPAQARASVFCIHGFTGNGGDFEYLAGFLAQKGYTVVCPDLIGRGASTYFGDPATYTIESYVTCLGALSRYAGESNCFIGTSWGGALVMYFLGMTRLKVEKVVLNDVGLRNGPHVRQLMKDIVFDSQQTFGTLEDAHAYVRRTRDYLGDFSEDLWPRYLQNKVRFSEGKFRMAYDPACAAVLPEIVESEYDLYPMLKKIKSEILLLFGVHSKFYEPDVLAPLLHQRPNISCIADLESGHPPSLMTYEQALMIGRFLAGC